MLNALKQLPHQATVLAERVAARAWLRRRREPPGLITFMFHRLTEDPALFDENLFLPQQRTTVAQFREFIGYMVEAGYRFIRPAELEKCRTEAGHYALITFDDGYHDNQLALAVLAEFQAPAVFFISTRHVLEEKLIWSDVVWRERKKRGVADDRILAEIAELVGWRTDQLEARLRGEFGADALKPRSDVDRVLTARELTQFSRHPQVVIGNHTANHAVLSNYRLEEATTEVQMAQDHLLELTGRRPEAIAYPCGRCPAHATEAALRAGLQYGFTTESCRLDHPRLASADPLRLPRCALWGQDSLRDQCAAIRLDLHWYERLKSLLQPTRRTGVSS